MLPSYYIAMKSRLSHASFLTTHVQINGRRLMDGFQRHSTQLLSQALGVKNGASSFSCRGASLVYLVWQFGLPHCVSLGFRTDRQCFLLHAPGAPDNVLTERRLDFRAGPSCGTGGRMRFWWIESSHRQTLFLCSTDRPNPFPTLAPLCSSIVRSCRDCELQGITIFQIVLSPLPFCTLFHTCSTPQPKHITHNSLRI